jgi:hypothetical protein
MEQRYLFWFFVMQQLERGSVVAEDSTEKRVCVAGRWWQRYLQPATVMPDARCDEYR